MKKFFYVFLCLGFFSACDLQPRIASIPDDVGDFISARYPTLLAEPDSDIYKTAVADYGVYASASEYGNGDITDADYVLYSPADDYTMPAQDTDVDENDVGMPDDEAEVETPAQSVDEYGFAPDRDVDDLVIPDYKTADLVVAPRKQENAKPSVKPETKQTKSEPVKSAEKVSQNKIDAKVPEKSETAVRAPVREITVATGDTLYSLSRKYSVPVNDLAVMNKISAPFTLSVGQKLRVPDVASVSKSGRAATPTQSAKTVESKTSSRMSDVKTSSKKSATVQKNTATKSDVKRVDAKTTQAKKPTSVHKVESKKTDTKKVETKNTNAKQVNAKKAETKTAVKTDAAKKTNTANKTATAKNTGNKGGAQKMMARSASRFSWPVRGKILSGYGAKSNGLFNDGINIRAARGATVAAAENGLVAYAGNEVKGMGNLVIIQHSDGWMTVYAHMDSMVVRRGSAVRVGQKIGTVGQTGKVDAPQLHFEIRKGTRAYNPINYLKK